MNTPIVEPPENFQEFAKIAGLIFVDLVPAFPAPVIIDRARIARALGADGPGWSDHRLPSGRTLGLMIEWTIAWLAAEGFTRAWSGARDNIGLTEKGLVAMNAMPSGLRQTVGTALVEASRSGTPDLTRVGSLIGGAIGGLIKTVGG